MDKVRYSHNSVYSYIYYTSLDIFMGANPPCKECLVNSMCINNDQHGKILKIKVCEKLNTFAENNYWFDKR